MEVKHPLNCPVCRVQMQEVRRSGVTIDVCPDCRGVWLDRGELERILDLEASGPARPTAPRYEERRRDHDYDDHHGHGHDDGDERYGRRGRRRGFLGSIFESFGGDD